MAGKRHAQYNRGEASNFISRKQAMKKLQLSLKDFRRLCILKGIHPREPRNRKRAQKGDMTKVATLFHEKDIRFLMHEPIVNRFRDFKVFLRKLKKATDKGDKPTMERLEANRPRYTLDHVVKERYPTFVDAIRDLEDCLCLCFLYATFPRTARTPSEMTSLCGRLTTEFMHVVMESRALRKVFVSIKGYYYQAELLGQTVTWVVPHSFVQRRPEGVDLRLMSIFVEFYTTMLGFVNFRLYHNLNLKYPPTLEGYDISKPNEKAAALNQSLNRSVLMDEGTDNTKLDEIVDASSDEKLAVVRQQQEERRRLQTLFEGLRFYLSREVPQTPLVFMIRSCGGQVSWAEDPHSLFKDDDPSITHHIVDRPSVEEKHLNRCYLQPQWVFDSLNRRQRVEERNYLAGKLLPPHLSPFVEERRIGEYAPPEEINPDHNNEVQEENNDEETVEDDEMKGEENDDEDEDEEDKEDGEDEDMEANDSNPLSRMRVDVGRVDSIDPSVAKASMEAEEMKLRKMMIKKKHRGLYRSMMKARNRREKEAKVLQRKRKAHDDLKSSKKVAKSM